MPKDRHDLTIFDVAKAADVSAATVSRVLNGTASVNAAKVERVKEAAKRLNYKPNPFARYLLGHTTDAVGVLVPQLNDEFYGHLIAGLEERFREHGRYLLCSLGHDQPNMEIEALQLFRDRQVSGLILVSDHLPEKQLVQLAESELPVVLINRFVPELAPHCIRIDNHWSGALATQHLIELGHTRIAHISGPLNREGARERLAGYRAALSQAGLARDDMLVVEGDFTEEAGRSAVERLLKLTSFSALFAANDRMAAGALHALFNVGLSVPEDVAVVGFDNTSFSKVTIPPLTTVDYPMAAMGRKAAEHLVALGRGEKPQALPLIQPSLIERRSTNPQIPDTIRRSVF